MSYLTDRERANRSYLRQEKRRRWAMVAAAAKAGNPLERHAALLLPCAGASRHVLRHYRIERHWLRKAAVHEHS